MQGQNFCITCGRIVPAKAPADTAKKVKRPVGRPRAGKLDIPTPATVAHLAASGPAAVSPLIQNHNRPMLAAEPSTEEGAGSSEKTPAEAFRVKISKFNLPSETTQPPAEPIEPPEKRKAAPKVKPVAEPAPAAAPPVAEAAEAAPPSARTLENIKGPAKPRHKTAPKKHPAPGPTEEPPAPARAEAAAPEAIEPTEPADTVAAAGTAPQDPAPALVPEASAPADEPAEAAPAAAPPDYAERPEKVVLHSPHWHVLISGAISAMASPRLLFFTLPAGLAAGGALSVALLNGLHDPATWAGPLSPSALRSSLEVGALVVAASALGDWSLLVGVYRQGGEFDRRRQHPGRWGRAGLASFHKLVALDIFWAVCGALTLAVIGLLGWLSMRGGVFPPELLGPASAGLTILLLIAAALVRASRNLAIPAFVLGGLSVRDGMKVSRILMSAYVSLSIKASLALLTLGALLSGLAVITLDYLPRGGENHFAPAMEIIPALTLGLALSLIVTLGLAGRAGWLEASYRQLVPILMPAKSARLLTGRRSGELPFRAMLIFAAAVIAPLAAIVALEVVGLKVR